ncbi:MAG: hypothetical protein JWP36_712 [Paucimonas sp.]|nr:hypothetical protein [Paucimonas sp.]
MNTSITAYRPGPAQGTWADLPEDLLKQAVLRIRAPRTVRALACVSRDFRRLLSETTEPLLRSVQPESSAERLLWASWVLQTWGSLVAAPAWCSFAQSQDARMLHFLVFDPSLRLKCTPIGAEADRQLTQSDFPSLLAQMQSAFCEASCPAPVAASLVAGMLAWGQVVRERALNPASPGSTRTPPAEEPFTNHNLEKLLRSLRRDARQVVLTRLYQQGNLRHLERFGEAVLQSCIDFAQHLQPSSDIDIRSWLLDLLGSVIRAAAARPGEKAIPIAVANAGHFMRLVPDPLQPGGSRACAWLLELTRGIRENDDKTYRDLCAHLRQAAKENWPHLGEDDLARLTGIPPRSAT